MTRIGKKINQQSRELAEKDQVISSLRTAIANFKRHAQREIESQEEQLEEKMEALASAAFDACEGEGSESLISW